MKNKFFEYYRYSDEQLDDIWDNCIFVFDTNVLLNFHVYNQENVKDFLKSFNLNPDKFWIPYHVGEEYHKNLYTKILEQIVVYDTISKELDESKNEIIKFCKKFDKHPYFDMEEYLKNIEKEYDNFINGISECKNNNPSGTDETEVTTIIKDFFIERIGEKFSEIEIKQIEEEGEIRYSKEIPPGYKDGKKDNGNEYGDLIIWYEIIKYAQKVQKPIVYITEDKKDDYWNNVKGKTIGPAPQLIREFYDKTGQYYYQYRFDQFLKYYQDKYGVETNKLIIEVEDLNKKKEERKNVGIKWSEIISRNDPSYNEFLNNDQYNLMQTDLNNFTKNPSIDDIENDLEIIQMELGKLINSAKAMKIIIRDEYKNSGGVNRNTPITKKSKMRINSLMERLEITEKSIDILEERKRRLNLLREMQINQFNYDDNDIID